MAKDKKQNNLNILQKPLNKLNSLFFDTLSKISYNNSNTDNSHEQELTKLNKQIDDILSGQIQSLTSFTGEDISTFLIKYFNDNENKQNQVVKTIEDMFNKDNNGLGDFFQNRYKNMNLRYEDLNMLCSQLYELQEAVDATRDAILTSDDLTNRVSRTLKFRSKSTDDNAEYIATIEEIESKFNLHHKLRNHIIPKTLQYGSYYVYTVPYSELFTKYYNNKNKAKTTLENYGSELANELSSECFDGRNANKVKEALQSYLGDIEIYNDTNAIPVLEGEDVSQLIQAFPDNNDDFQKTIKNIEKGPDGNKKLNVFHDGTVESKGNKKDSDFSFIKDCYIKLIDPRKMIPIKILEKVIGYYYIHESDVNVSKSPFTTAIRFTQNVNMGDSNVEQTFVAKLSEKIVKSFNKPFLEKNEKFKDLILHALEYNDMYKKKLKFQFIPVDYITEFKVNEDSEGNGVTILDRSLYYGKLYLAILTFKILSILSRSNDTKIYYVKNSGIDTDVINKVQEVARNLKEKQVNFMDLMNIGTMYSKIGQAKDIFMPVGRSGEHGIDFDVLAGQDVQLNTDLTDMLRTGMINGTGVPSVIMNYINEADYAKTLVMANAKFVGRVVSHQGSLAPSVTEMYKKIIKFTTDWDNALINDFEYTFNTPKYLNNMNMADTISNTDQLLAFIVKVKLGENASPSEDDNLLKDILYEAAAQEFAPFIPWAKVNEMIKDAKLKVAEKKIQKKTEPAEEQT